jgi:hypothetical protein
VSYQPLVPRKLTSTILASLSGPLCVGLNSFAIGFSVDLLYLLPSQVHKNGIAFLAVLNDVFNLHSPIIDEMAYIYIEV